MIKLYQFILLLIMGTFIFSCQEDQAITSQPQQQEIEVGVDPSFLKEQDHSSGRTEQTVALSKVRFWLNRDQWAGGKFRFVVIEKESKNVIVKSAQLSVTVLTKNEGAFTRVSFYTGGVSISSNKTYKVNLEFTDVHDDVGKVYAGASDGNSYPAACGPTCSVDLAFDTSITLNGQDYIDQAQYEMDRLVVVNGYTTSGQEFIPLY